MQRSNCGISRLPNELKYIILFLSSADSICNLMCVNKIFNLLANEEPLYKKKYEKDFSKEFQKYNYEKPIEMSWKEYYLKLSLKFIKHVQVTYLHTKHHIMTYNLLIRKNITSDEIKEALMSKILDIPISKHAEFKFTFFDTSIKELCSSEYLMKHGNFKMIDSFDYMNIQYICIKRVLEQKR